MEQFQQRRTMSSYWSIEKKKQPVPGEGQDDWNLLEGISEYLSGKLKTVTFSCVSKISEVWKDLPEAATIV